ncbi:MAG: 4Fe-4S dicluster domain-containing protein, partial [Chloroflexi bacterium]|nr:4Fe-4S dicluster domain-containing protein [Chloroflexota bacterium]
RFSSPEFDFGTFFYVHLITLGITVILVLLIARFWCRYLCPLGAIFGVFNRVSLVKIKLDHSQCTGCEECLRHCPGGIKKAEDIGNGTDCTQCAKCVEACPSEALRISASLRD